MADLLHNLVHAAADRWPEKTALVDPTARLSYATLSTRIASVAAGLVQQGARRRDRIAVYLPKQAEAVEAIFAAFHFGGIAIPLNPVLKAPQVGHILRDSGTRFLITSIDRWSALADELGDCETLEHVILVGADADAAADSGAPGAMAWDTLQAAEPGAPAPVIDADIAALLYTSGSTGKPKGVVLSHRNMVAGAVSVASYLGNHADDRILAVLPLSFDAGFSQLTTAFHSGATAVLHEFFLPRGILKVAEAESITGITAVPPLWIQLAELDWPEPVRQGLRYFANTGGKMPRPLLERLREQFPNASPFLMYGLTEAFRSTYLPPSEVDRRPDSIGKAIPNAEILVVREDGTPCEPGEPGELVHRGALVAQGYWNDEQKTRARFRPAPASDLPVPIEEIAVWSGDTVTRDEDGFLYFVGRKDDMIKSSGYRISPTEIEESLYASGLVSEAAALGIEDGALGHRIVIATAAAEGGAEDTDALIRYCRREMPTYMVPAEVVWMKALPRNPNGKIDRKLLMTQISSAGGDTA